MARSWASSPAFSSRTGPRISPADRGLAVFLSPNAAYNARTTISGLGRGTTFMQQQGGAEFGIAEAKRVLGEVFAPWVQDLNLSIEDFDFTPPAGGSADWQPG